MFIIQAFLFGTIFVISRLIIPPLNAISYIFIRSVIGGITVFAVVLGTKKVKEFWIFLKENRKILMELGMFYYPVSLVILFFSIPYTTATNQALLNNFSVVSIVFLNYFIFKKDVPKKIRIATTVTTLGAFLIMWPFSLSENPTLIGDIMVIISMVLSGLYGIKIKPIADHSNPFFLTLALCILSAIVLFPFIFFFGQISAIQTLEINQWLVLLWLGVGIAGFGYVINSYIYHDKEVTPEIAGLFSTLIPIIGMIIGIAFYHDELSIINYIGAILIIFSLYIAQLKKKDNIPNEAQ
jgi:drug/metabolite transporter (DMT)-like permease